jgi:inorganic pyrophosphatase
VDDYKILTATAHDPRLAELTSLGKVPAHRLTEIDSSIQVYKDLEGKDVQVAGWENLETARRIIDQCRAAYRNT